MKLDQCPVVLLNEWLPGNLSHPVDPGLDSLSGSIHCLHSLPRERLRHDLDWKNQHFRMAVVEVLKWFLGISHVTFCRPFILWWFLEYYIKFSSFILWSCRTLLLWPVDVQMETGNPSAFSLFLLAPQRNLELWKGILGKWNYLALTSTLSYSL